MKSMADDNKQGMLGQVIIFSNRETGSIKNLHVYKPNKMPKYKQLYYR